MLCCVAVLFSVAFSNELFANPDFELLIRIREHKFVHDYGFAANSGNITKIKTYNEGSKDIPWDNFIRTSLPWTVWTERNPSEAPNFKKVLADKEFFSEIAISPDFHWVALSVGNPDSVINHKHKEISLVSTSDFKEKKRIKLIKGRYVGDLAWRSDSSKLLVLEKTERVGLNPLELLSAFAGHPVPHNSFYLAIFDAIRGEFSEATSPFAEDIEYASGWFAQSKPN
ncbi:hypothetical protein GHYDROH2_28180 [Geobacter hydrogenophilus]|uniref:Uncharacterized protein n=2 Tax=Geobacter hydrogenophilus TaxID=40983 RepID=A0A9W6G2T1_9BACT|nr:hypothetical protein GHYDROH2_28180 [Geobacter hydrogenophilus]